MAKKSTWEKRASKVRKEEYIVLGGNTNRKKQGVKKKYPSSGEGGGYKGGSDERSSKPSYTITREGDDAKKPSRDGAGSGNYKGNKGRTNPLISSVKTKKMELLKAKARLGRILAKTTGRSHILSS
jgi:hypothetical protein